MDIGNQRGMDKGGIIMLDNKMERQISLTEMEVELIYNQLSARYQDFEFMMYEAAKKGNTDRVLNIAKVLESLQTIMTKLLDMQ